VLGIILYLPLSAFLADHATAFGARETKMIRVYGSTEGDKLVTRLEPNEVGVGKGVTIVWVNMSESEIKVVFPEGKTCQVSTSAALGWKLDAKECYITDYAIPPGGTSSVYFNKIGEYEYEVEFIGKDRKEKGSILVRTEAGTYEYTVETEDGKIKANGKIIVRR